MFLKKLEIVGFKSFAQKTVFEFEPGMTAVVGPNGCGKSNISDSIRWVLGEQSAKDLRGDMMEDVIFNGTVDAKPLGMAEVSLTLVDEKDELGLGLSEVAVTRRLFRSGESHYLINKKQCRLRDVLDLFADTGIGTDAYSHFEQGKIDAILSSKPEERREIFEEASGIMKYKRDKKMALRKLEATEDNLTRLNDIIREVKRQIISINRQAGKARRYKKLVEELSEIEIAVLVRNRIRMTEEDQGLRAKHGQVKASFEEINGQIESKEHEISSGRIRLQELETEYEKLQGKKLEILRNKDREANNISLCEERIESTKNLDESGKKQIEEMKTSIKVIEKDLESRRNELEKVAADKTACHTALAAKESEIQSFTVEFGSDESDLKGKSDRLMAVMREEVQVEDELKAILERREEDEVILNAVAEDYNSFSAKREELEKNENDLVQRKSSLDKRLIELSAETDRLRNSIEEKTRKRVENNRQMQALEQKLTQTESQHSLLRSMHENYEGYFGGVRAALKESKAGGSLSGIHGVVGDIITVERGYEVAIETALGNRIQNIIAETGEAVERTIDFLKKNRAGRATFLALDILCDTKTPESELSDLAGAEQGVLGCALDSVRYSPVYAPVVRFLMSRTIIVQDLNCALNIARKKHYNFTLVTPEGEMISSKGAISGGSAPDSSRGLLMREAHISELAQEKERLTSEINSLSGLMQTIERELAQFELEHAKIAGTVIPLRDDMSGDEKEFIRLSALKDSLDRQLLSLKSRTDEIEKRSKEAEIRRTELDRKLENLRSERSEIEAEMENVRKTIAGAEEKRVELQNALMEVRIKSASFIERESFLKSSCERLDDEIKERRESIKRKTEEIASGKHHVEELRKNIEFIKHAIAELDEEKNRTETAIELVDEQRAEIVATISSIEDQVRRNRLSLKAVQEEESALNIKLTELKFSISGIDDRLRNEYHMTADDPRVKQLPEETNWLEIEAKIEELRQKKDAIGEVNLYAIEEEERLQERYDILTEQQTDLINAKESLLKVISKINIEARKLFRETFEKVREEFKRRFAQLFGGGNADLILLDEHDILESGIDIVASPPGKKLKSITLLSGGEKAMTAVSLLLAIFAVKPSPFCLLDEVDAPLDDSNIGRFMDILREFLSHSQFIIVTHNKRTMAMAEVLYGITMEKSGISKVVSVRFRERKEAVPRISERQAESEEAPKNLIPEEEMIEPPSEQEDELFSNDTPEGDSGEMTEDGGAKIKD